MQEQVEIIEAMIKAQAARKKAALATIVGVIGSAYRREGAKMFIDEDGSTIGTISGGCLEADVAETAQQVILSGKPLRKRYVMDEELVWGLGLGCPGTVDILIEPVPGREEDSPVFFQWISALREGRPGILCTIIHEATAANESLPGRLFIPEKGLPTGHLGEHRWNRLAMEWAQEMFTQQQPKSGSHIMNGSEGSSVQLFMDVCLPPIELMIFGAGHDAIPLARIGKQLGLSVTIVDPRPAYNTEERFPGSKLVLIDPSTAPAQLMLGSRTFVVIMNHHLERDRSALLAALHSSSPYIGMLGPRKRCERVLNALLQEGHSFTADQLAHLYNPVGLDIGAESSEEIALSIITIRSGHKGGLLREAGSIHHSPAKSLLLRSQSG